MCAEAFQKVRINPGNFADGRKTFEEIDYEDPAQFEQERAAIEEIFVPLVLKCKELGTAMRIGTNHGSLSARILSFYGDTPVGACSVPGRRHVQYFSFLGLLSGSHPANGHIFYPPPSCALWPGRHSGVHCMFGDALLWIRHEVLPQS
jgi:hypothetical protein